MATDLATFNPRNFGELAEVLEEQIGDIATDWWNENKVVVSARMRLLAKAAMKTTKALAEGRIDQETAEEALAMQRSALDDVITYSQFMSLVLAERVKDALFKVIGQVILNRTGLSIPGLLG
jgi:hypothetical protein